MRKVCILAVFVLLGTSLASQEIQQPEPAVDTIMGEYVGLYSAKEGGGAPGEAKVIAEGGGRYRAVLTAKTEPSRIVELQRDLNAEGVSFTAASGPVPWAGRIENGIFSATAEEGEFRLLRIERCSPTEGWKAPAGAIVLLPFREGERTSLDEWTNKNWRLLPDGSMQVFKGHNQTIREHGSGIFHVEFKIPFEPNGRGQARGNSGVYFASRYEIQVLDSFGLAPGPGDCGSIYGVAVATENASLPPLSWQTYDVIYRAPCRNPDGTLEPAQMTVFHNGVKIHENQPIPSPTRAAPEGENAVRGPLYLQDHGHPVCYRNIWCLELPDAKN